MPILSTQNAQIFYSVEGEGIPLVLLSGLSSDTASWAPLRPLIQSKFQTISIDNRGCGQTKDQSDTIDPQDWLRDVLAVLDHLGVEHFCVLGHSLGGMLALRLALEAPDRVAAVITMAAANVPPAKAQLLIADLATLREQETDDRLWLRLFFQFLFDRSFFNNQAQVVAALEASLAYPHRQSTADFLRQVKATHQMQPATLSDLQIPVLSISGQSDILIPHADIEESLSDIPMLTTLQIEAAGHSIHWDQPQAVANAIQLFLSED